MATPQPHADRIVARLSEAKPQLQRAFGQHPSIPHCYLDDLLDERAARSIYRAFPPKEQMFPLKTLQRQHKYVLMQMDQVDPILAEIIYAFQDPRVVALVGEITGLAQLRPDPELYAGGISLMEEGGFLHPHLDNSHDRRRQLYRCLNLLYYVTPDWQTGYGGNLELWDQGLRYPCRTIESRFNRLVMMMTHQSSWHSVSRVCHPGRRCCVSNYYFSAQPPRAKPYTHITSFRGRPEEPWRDVILRADTWVRRLAPGSLKNILRQPQHYDQDSDKQ
ncbi:MAG: 2OG-Fe(II) oxygenase [Cyanobacteriota bacterium]|nr:2OG-Fe(II) oxygenase [Cyanobacteriota bacterium]